MAAPESLHQQIAETLRAGLAAIRADGSIYNFTPTLVDHVAFYPDNLDASRDVVYLLRPGEEEHTEEQSGGGLADIGMLANAEFFLLVAKRFEASGEEPGDQSDPHRAKVVNRLVRDALRYLLADVLLGGLAENVVDGSLFVNRDWADPMWAIAELRFVVRYSYRSGTP